VDDSARTPKEKLKCFVISPIGKPDSDLRKSADQALKHLIVKSLGSQYEITRGDEESNPGSITSQIVESILEADLVVADLSGFNPNVYYEVAIAHGYERPTVHIQRADETPAFDLKDMRIVRYDLHDPDKLEEAQKALADFARFARDNSHRVRTPLSDAKPFVQIAGSADPVAQSNLEVMEQLRALRSDVRSMGRAPAAPARASNPDVRSLRIIIDNAVARQAMTEADFNDAITPGTSSGFDRWSRRTLTKVSGETDADRLNDVLFNAAVRESDAEEDDD